MTPVNRRASNVKQRKKQQTLLDVKIRASTERRRMVGKIFSVTARLIIFSALTAGSWVGGKEALRRFVFENPDYAIREVKFVTDGTLTREQVLRTGDLCEGRNIFLINLSRASTEIEKMPQVENVEVTRTLPNRLSVTVTERRPIAWVVATAEEDPTVSEKAFLIDARGMLMKTKARLEEYLHFPVISGAQTENLVPGERVTTSEMQAALELIRLTSDSTRFQARHVDLSKGYCLVVTAHSHAKITFGLDHVDAQLARLHRYLARAAEDKKEIQTVNLIVERNTPITFVEPLPGDDSGDPGKLVDPKAKPAIALPVEKGKTAVAPPKAIPVATPIPAASAPATPKPNFFSNLRARVAATPAPAKADSLKKPFRLH